jgi:hypothetical protein
MRYLSRGKEDMIRIANFEKRIANCENKNCGFGVWGEGHKGIANFEKRRKK